MSGALRRRLPLLVSLVGFVIVAALAGFVLSSQSDDGPGSSALHDRYEVRNAMPITAFYDADGNLKYVAPGQLTKEKLSARLQEFFGVTL